MGCTGGKHRSVTLANELFYRLSGEEEYGLKIEHRDIGKDIVAKRLCDQVRYLERRMNMSFSGM